MLKAARWFVLIGLAAVLSPGPAKAQAFAIVHDPTIECFPADRSVLVRAIVPAGTRITRMRAHLRRARMPATWFWIDLRRAGLDPAGIRFEGGFPKPKNELIGEIIDYYLSAEVVDAPTGQTQEYRGEIVRNIEECKKRPLLARGASPGNFPPGFAGDPSLPAAAAPAPPAMPPPPGVTVTCDAKPSSGNAPLVVQFTSTPTGGTGQYGFQWSFGEPGIAMFSREQNPSFTYSQPGRYSALVRVTSPPQDPINPRPGAFADCRRVIRVNPASL